METEKELTTAIIKMTMTIHQTFPELSKYISEMPLKISYKTGDEIHIKNQRDYLESLKTLISKYKVSHPANK